MELGFKRRFKRGPCSLVVFICLFGLGACVGAGNRPVQLLSTAEPEFPTLAKSRGVEGYVIVEYSVSMQGIVLNPRIVESEPEGIFDTAALKAISLWQYKPMIEKGEIRQAENVRSRIEFRLGEPERYEDY